MKFNVVTCLAVENELTTTEAAEFLAKKHNKEISPVTVRLWCREGKLKAREEITPRGNYYLIAQSDLESFEIPQMGRPPKKKQ